MLRSEVLGAFVKPKNFSRNEPLVTRRLKIKRFVTIKRKIRQGEIKERKIISKTTFKETVSRVYRIENKFGVMRENDRDSTFMTINA